jgi:aminopeptidase N
MQRVLAAASVLCLSLTGAASASQGASPGASQRASSEASPGAGGPAGFRPGAPGVGDPYFPLAGNGGYHAGHYDLTIGYDPATRGLTGTAVMDATATQDLSRFDLDLVGLTVDGVSVNGTPATFARAGQELQITPSHGLEKGTAFHTKIVYHGVPGRIDDPALGRTGWLRTADGIVTLSQPLGSSTWFPVNDHPSDKATYSYHVTVPTGLRVLANGEPERPVENGGRTTFTWVCDRPMADYLAMIAIGHFDVRSGRTPGGIKELVAVSTAPDERHSVDIGTLYRETAEATDWESKVFGPFPFSSTGGITDGAQINYALETQTRPVYGFTPDQSTIVHELAHQWYGDSVSLRSWRDIWLNEGFATYAEWLWDEQHGGMTAQQHFEELYATPAGSPSWRTLPGDPGRGALFAGFPVYDRGAMTLQALRQRVGDDAFFRILRAWAAQRRYSTGSTADFRALAEQISGRDLHGLFQSWLYTPSKP